MSKKQKNVADLTQYIVEKPKAEETAKKTRKRYELSRRLPMIVHSQKLSDNLDLEHKVTGKDYTVIMNQRLEKSYETNPVKLKNDE